ncbi:MAG: hypothetical protein ABI780_07540 [Ardenticatenales bacterium]
MRLYPPQLAFLGLIDGTSLLRRCSDGQPLPPGCDGVGALEDALREADAAGIPAVWACGRVRVRGADGEWLPDGGPVSSGIPSRATQLSLLGAWA